MRTKVWKDTFPTMIAMLFAGLYGVIDGVFIGNATGDIGLAAINLVWPIPAVITAIGTGIGVGGSIWISYYRGKGELEAEKKVYGSIWTLILISGLLVTVVLRDPSHILRFLGAQGAVYEEAIRYARIIIWGALFQIAGTGLIPVLRNKQMSFEAMIGMITGMLLNIGINYYMIFQLGFKVEGAAYGTVIAQGIVMLLSASFLFIKKKEGVYFYWNKQLVTQIFRSFVTPFGVSIAPTIALIFTNWQCLRYGGDTAVASYAVVSYISFPVQNLLAGIGDGTQPLMSYYCGAKKMQEVKQIRRIAYQMLFTIGAVTTLASLGLTKQIGILFAISKEGYAYFSDGLKMTAIAFILMGMTKFNLSWLNATMRTKEAVLYTYLESLCVTPILLQILPRLFSMDGIWLTPLGTAVVMLLIFWVRGNES